MPGRWGYRRSKLVRPRTMLTIAAPRCREPVRQRHACRGVPDQIKARINAQAEEAMRTEFAILIGAGVLSLVVGLDSSTPSNTASRLVQSGNNPGKRYDARHAPAGSVTESTLATNGNNPARRAATTTGAGR